MIAIFPEIAGSVAVRDYEMLAVLVRKYFGGKEKYHPQMCMETILLKVGVRRGVERLDYIGALVAKDEKGRFDVASVTSDDHIPIEDFRFLLAHQLGHYFLHIQPLIARGEWRSSGFTEVTSPSARYEKDLLDGRLSADQELKEKEADQFAACVLMPLGMTKKAYKKLGNVEKLAKFFGVRVNVAVRRLEEIMGNETQPSNFIAAEKKIDPRHDRDNPERTGHQKLSGDALAESIKIDLSKHRKYPTEKVDQQKPSTPEVEKIQGRPAGMDRIRELARKIDPGVN